MKCATLELKVYVLICYDTGLSGVCLYILLPRRTAPFCVGISFFLASSNYFPSNLTQTTKCMHGGTTPWVSVVRGTLRGPSLNPRRSLAWMESPSSRSLLARHTAWHGRHCPETGQFSPSHLRADTGVNGDIPML